MWVAIGDGILSLLHWKILFALLLYTVIYVGIMYAIGVSRVFGDLGSGFPMMIGGASAGILLQPVFLAAVADVVINRGNVDFSRAFNHFGYLLLAGLIGWLFAMLLGLIPLLGSLLRSDTISMVVSSLPVTLAVLSPGIGFGTIIGASIAVLLDSWLFLVLLVVAAYALQWLCIFVATGVARAIGEQLPGDGVPAGPVFGVTTWALQPFVAAFPVFALMHWMVTHYLVQ